jgi:hypothetical protein
LRAAILGLKGARLPMLMLISVLSAAVQFGAIKWLLASASEIVPNLKCQPAQSSLCRQSGPPQEY